MFRISTKGNNSPQSNIVKKYCDALLAGRKRIDFINKLCKCKLNMSFEEVVCASPKKIIEIHKLLNNNKMLDEPCIHYLTNTLYKSLDRETSKGNAKRILLESLDVRVCPYCNRNFVYTINNLKDNNILTTCELDHFFPKSLYPLLAVSFYNLIPSCHVCNHIKGNEELLVLYPYNISEEDIRYIRFTYRPLKTDYIVNKDSLVVGINVHARSLENNSHDEYLKIHHIEHDINVLKLRQMYEKHNDVVQNLLLKYEVLDDSYIEAIYEGFKCYFSSEEEIRNLIFELPKNIQEVFDTPLGKLKMDILSEIKGEISSRPCWQRKGMSG